MVLLEANLDDATGETLAHAVEACSDAGAHDAWITPVVMKKGRPGHTVSALVDPALVASVRHASAGRDRHSRGAGHLAGAVAGDAGPWTRSRWKGSPSG